MYSWRNNNTNPSNYVFALQGKRFHYIKESAFTTSSTLNSGNIIAETASPHLLTLFSPLMLIRTRCRQHWLFFHQERFEITYEVMPFTNPSSRYSTTHLQIQNIGSAWFGSCHPVWLHEQPDSCDAHQPLSMAGTILACGGDQSQEPNLASNDT